MPNFSDRLRSLLFGNPFGEVGPPRAAIPPLAVDGRTVALRILRDYLSELTFFRAGARGGPPIAFQVPAKNIHIEQPDGIEDMVFPSIAVIPARADYQVIGLTSYIEEKTKDVYAPGTVLQWMMEYEEHFDLEIWASKKAERRALLSGIETAFVPTEQMYGIRFRMPDYFNELVCFTLLSRTNFDDASDKDRRRARFNVEMRFNIVQLVNYVTLQPQAVIDGETQDNVSSVVIDVDGTSKLSVGQATFNPAATTPPEKGTDAVRSG